MTDSTGTAVGTWTYDSYGKVTASTGSVSNPFGYAGQYTDAETGFQYLRARYYDPVTGQFLTRDPAVATTHSAYGYTGGNPLNGADPSGLDWRQTIANGAGGVLNGLTLGHEKTITGWLGISDHVDRCSGAYAIGTQVGQGILVVVADGAVGELLEGVSAADEGAAVSQEGEGIVDERVDANGGTPYVGQAKSESRFLERQAEHARANPDSDFSYEVRGRAEPGEQLDRMEEHYIREGGGPTNKSNPDGGLANQ